MRTYLRVVLWGQFQSPFVRIPIVQFKRVSKHKSATLAHFSRNCQASTELAWISWIDQDEHDARSSLQSLSQQSEDQQRSKTNEEPPSQLCKRPHHYLLSLTDTLSKHPLSSHRVWPQQNTTWVWITWDNQKLPLQWFVLANGSTTNKQESKIPCTDWVFPCAAFGTHLAFYK